MEQGQCEQRVRGCGNRIEGRNGGSERTQRGRGNARVREGVRWTGGEWAAKVERQSGNQRD